MASVRRRTRKRYVLARYIQKLQEGGYSFLGHERPHPSMEDARYHILHNHRRINWVRLIDFFHCFTVRRELGS